MDLYIMEEDRIRNVQCHFQEAYPHLGLQFYKKPRKHGQSLPDSDRFSPVMTIEEVIRFRASGKVNIGPQRTVAQVEQDFFRNMGLCVQVFRQVNDTWLATTDTDDRTLQEQEQKAIESLESDNTGS